MLFHFHQGLLSNLSCYKFCISVAGTIRDDLDTERQLEDLAMDFRLQWITLAHSLIAGVMKSPPRNHIPLLPISLSSNFLYERVLRPILEDRIKETVPDIPGRQTEMTVFFSGMARLAPPSLFYVIKKLNIAEITLTLCSWICSVVILRPLLF
jgi:hypothetical protein